MLLFIILALLVVLARSLIPLAATDADFTFDAVVAIAGLLSFIALFGYIFWPQGASGKSDVAVRPAGRAIAGSGLVRRLVRSKDDPAKQRIRAKLSEIDDERLFGLGLTSEDIAALRGTASPEVKATIAQGVDALSEDSCVYQISPPIAGVLDATHDMWRNENNSRPEVSRQ